MRYVETIKIVDGVVQQFEYHKRRAYSTTGIIMPDINVPKDMCSGVVKCRMVYDNEVSAIEFIPYVTPTIQSLKVIDVVGYFYDKKYTDRAQLQELFNQRQACHDVLITVNGLITDTSFCNVVLENEEGLFTPQLPLLHGTKRAFLIDQGVIEPRVIRIDELKDYRRMHLINAMIDLDNPTTIVDINNVAI